MDFNQPIDRRKTHSSKWGSLETKFGVSGDNGIAMSTADSDYRTADCIIEAVQREAAFGVYGYSQAGTEYTGNIQWWMKTRHGWDIDPSWILTSQGLGFAIAQCLAVWSEPGDHAAIFTPVYHEFARKVAKAGRNLTECPLKLVGERYELDLEDAQKRLTGKEKILLWCSPQNPSGRVWDAHEIRAVSDFAKANGMLLVSDEIHHDLVFSPNTFVPTAVAVPDGWDNTVYLTSASKTFSIAGLRTGQMIIPDDGLRAAMVKRLNSLDYKPSWFGVVATQAAYTPEGAAWADAQMEHLGVNRTIMDEGINAIPGVRSLPLQATYLPWLDFSGTGMGAEEIQRRIREDAKIAALPGPIFGTGQDSFIRLNIATQTPIVEEAVTRLQRAFGDLQ